MRFIFIVLFLVTFGSISMGGEGEVYYCEILTHTRMNAGERYIFPPQKDDNFKFIKYDTHIQFGKKGWFKNVEDNYTISEIGTILAEFGGHHDLVSWNFSDNRFNYADTFLVIEAMTAHCEKF